MRSSMSFFLPEPLTMVVFSLSIITFLALPSMASVTFSSLMPRSSLIAWPPVRTAMSCSMALRRSPKPGAFVADLFHRLGEVVADFLVAVGGNGADLGDFGVRGDLLGVLLELLDDGLDREVDAALEIHRVHAGGNRLRTFLDDRGGKHRRGRGAVTGDVGGL